MSIHTIDTIKNFETVGFTRGQAEMQVRTIEDIKKGLMTQKDGENLVTTLRAEISEVKSEIFSIKSELHSIRNDMKWIPIQSAFYTITTLVSLFALIGFWPKIQQIFESVLK